MTPERFRQIEELYHAAREKTGAQREALLAGANPEMRREVEELLAQTESGFLARPAVPDATEPGDATVTALTTGTCLGPYRIESKLGEGGMGEVFRAVDTRLGRAVAVKVTHAKFSDRFEREARATAALNHPHICTLHDVGPDYLVMEFLEGETLAQRLKRGKLSMDETLRYAGQIASALVAAHGKGIIHRDLKPGNIMLVQSGVKVLDFGLAKAEQDEMLTAPLAVMGTPGYMAPEQREGKPADARSDIYSFGCVLYEMITGARVSPAPRKRIGSRKVERIVSRCLEQDPARRWQSAVELDRELSEAGGGTAVWKAGAVAAAVLALSTGLYFYLHRAPKLSEKDTIILADFDNKTGDPVFDDTLREGLSVELQQSPYLSLIGDQQVQKTLALMGQPKDARLTPEIAREICERTGSSAILAGSIRSLGSQYVLGLQAKTCDTGNILDQEQVHAARREDVLDALSQIARKFRTRVGESLATVEQHSTPLWEATTPSLEALKVYTTGHRAALSAGSATTGSYLRRAVEIDPRFAMAWANLGLAYSSMGESAQATESTIKAWQLRDRVSDWERFFIEVLYHREVTGDLQKAYQTLELWNQTYPRGGDREPPNPQELLAGLSTRGTGRFERAIEMAQKTIAGHPDTLIGYGSLAYSYIFLDRFPEAESILQRASEHRWKDNPILLVSRYKLAVLKGDKDQMDRAVALARGQRGAEHWMAHEEALALARSGRLQDARRSSNRATDLALQEEAHEEAATYEAARAVWESVSGNAPEAKKSAIAALEISKAREVEYAAGLALAFSGDTSRSEALAGDLEKRFPEDTFVKFTYVPVLHACAALERSKPADSVERLQIALRYELAANGLNFAHHYLGGLYSAYVRGEAFMAEHRYAEAEGEFQKILDHRGLVGLDPIGALAHVQLGRVFASSGDRVKAKAAYEAFFALWKDADPDVPILKSAKAEYGRL